MYFSRVCRQPPRFRASFLDNHDCFIALIILLHKAYLQDMTLYALSFWRMEKTVNAAVAVH